MIIKNFVRKPEPININKVIVSANVIYWEDCEIGGQEFDEGSDENVIKDLLGRYDNEYKIGLVDGNLLRLIINPETGKVENYAGEKEVRMHFKVCDECSWEITEHVPNGINPYDAYDNPVLKEENYYVPDFLEIDDNGYGDYIEITIQTDGTIKNWNPEWFAQWVEKTSKALNGSEEDN